MLAGLALPVSAYAQCVTDTPAVDACRGGVRVTAAAALPPGATLDLSFLAATLDPSVTWTRTTGATDGFYTDAAGSGFNNFAANAPRISVANGLLVEGGTRTNYLINSGSPVTLTTGTLPIGTYTLWIVGTGTATSSAGTAVGSGFGVASAGVPNVFTVSTAGTAVVTMAGSLTRFQLENNPYPTSYILTTASTATRTIESGIIATSAWFNAAEGTLVTDFVARQLSAVLSDLPSLQTDTANVIESRINNGVVTNLSIVTNANNGSVATPGAFSANTVSRHGITYNSATKLMGTALNGGAYASAVATALPAIGRIFIGAARSVPLDGFIRRVRYWPRALSQAELQSVTT